MRPIGFISIGIVAALGLAIAAKTSAAAAAPASKPKPKPETKPPATTPGDAPPITGFPPELIKLIEEARASDDPQALRDAAYQLADKYPLQAADLLALATILEQPADMK